MVDVGVLAGAPKVIPLQAEPGLEGIRARDIRRGEAGVVFGDKPPGVTTGPNIIVGIGAVHGVQREIRDPDVVRSYVRLPSRVLVQYKRRLAGFKEEPVGGCVGPADER